MNDINVTDPYLAGSKSYAAYMNAPYKSIKHSTYFPVYDQIFSRFIGKPMTFIEIGVLDGGSLFMWREFFGPKARIIGVDLNPTAKKWEKDGFEIYIGSQEDKSFLEYVFKAAGEIDIILDDGGHTFEQQVNTCEVALDYVKDDGLIFVEDTHTSYMPKYGGPSKYSFISYVSNIINGINYRYSEFVDKSHDKAIYSVSIYESIVVFNINRALCGLKSHPTSNNGISSDEIDYCLTDAKGWSLLEYLRIKLKFIKKYPLIGAFSEKLYYKFKVVLLMWPRISRLKKYFKYEN